MGPILIVVMGVSGSGKSTLARALAEELDMTLYDADELHPKSNVEKMSRGEPLNDADREPWLETVRTTAEHACAEQQAHQSESGSKIYGVVIACSALKKRYRDIIRGVHDLDKPPSNLKTSGPPRLPTYFVFISGPRELILERMSTRKGHFMKSAMLDSQLQTLENPEGEESVITISLEESTESQVKYAKDKLMETLGVGNQ